MSQETSDVLGIVDWDRPSAINERVLLRAPRENRARVVRNQFVRIVDTKNGSMQFLGRTVAGPFFSEQARPHPEKEQTREGDITAEIEIQGELVDGRPRDTNNRPAPGS